MTTAQEGGSTSPKITVPLCVSTFSFFINGKPNIWMTATQTYQIYSGAIAAWGAAVPGSAVSGYGDGMDGTAMTYAGLKKVEGTQAVCDAIAATKGAIGYAFTGACSVTAKRQFAAVKNAAGVAIVPSKWKPGAAIPTTPPAAPDASWATVDFIYKGRATTPPMVSMEFAFIRKTVSGAQGRIAKAFSATPPAWLNPSSALLNAIVVSA
ncbi:unnamed protein product [Closterium sp. Naga37s-1]|nr:unnamed protein product [Closterium sp. Naga37s-1]CAI5506621.1 unnamed protein product [Closterium sp. Naga37s-1]